MKVEKLKWITRQIARQNPHKLFLFGDNLERRGMGGQAKEMRGEPNTLGIPTKFAPTMNDGDFFSDEGFVGNCGKIDQHIRKIRQSGFEIVVIPSDGLGTGLAELDKRAPRTFAYLEQQLADLSE